MFVWCWVVGGGGGGGLESKLSDQLWLSFSLALAKPNKMHLISTIFQTSNKTRWDNVQFIQY
jgi:hypothetical protein